MKLIFSCGRRVPSALTVLEKVGMDGMKQKMTITKKIIILKSFNYIQDFYPSSEMLRHPQLAMTCFPSTTRNFKTTFSLA
jgi:hypothetical protein